MFIFTMHYFSLSDLSYIQCDIVKNLIIHRIRIEYYVVRKTLRTFRVLTWSLTHLERIS